MNRTFLIVLFFLALAPKAYSELDPVPIPNLNPSIFSDPLAPSVSAAPSVKNLNSTQAPLVLVDDKSKIRVRISKNNSKGTIQGHHLSVLRLQKATFRFEKFESQWSDWQFECKGGKVYLQEGFPPKNPFPFPAQPAVSVQNLGGFLHFNQQVYRDEIQIYAQNSQCEVVNRIDLEKYLDGIVNAEISSKWNEESILAQVIAARTYAYYQMQETRKNKPTLHYDVDSSTADQVYNGVLREDFGSVKAVTKTQGLILTLKRNQVPEPIKAFYHSTCGGTTELPQSVWGVSYFGFKQQVKCPYCQSSPRYHWTLELSVPDLTANLLKGLDKEGLPLEWKRKVSNVQKAKDVLQKGKLMDLWVKREGADWRIAQVTMLWMVEKKMVELPLKAVRFRDWMGVTQIKSTSFQAASLQGGKAWRFDGQGSGHGVGMCQWGAKTMAEKGFKAESILKFYYPDAVLRKMW